MVLWVWCTAGSRSTSESSLLAKTVHGGQILAAGTRNLIGPLTIELSTEVNCLGDSLTIFDQTAIAKEQVCRGKRVAQRYFRRSSRIAIISFSPENGVRFDASSLSLGAEKYSNSEVRIPFYRIVSRNFHLKAFS